MHRPLKPCITELELNLAELRIEFWPQPEPQAPIAFLTMARDEPFMVRAWIENGLRICPDAEFYVLDHASDPLLVSSIDAIADELGAKISFVRLPPIPFDDDFKAMALTSFAKMLLQGFEVVITTDSDELLVGLGITPDQVLPRLRAIEGIVAPIGFEIVQHVARESRFDPSVPLERQRAYGFLTSGYTKPVVWKQRSEFSGGLHGVRDDFAYEASLGLLHLRSVDVDIAKRRATHRRDVELSSAQISANRGAHWTRDPRQKVDFFAKLNAQTEIPDYECMAPGFLDALSATHRKGPGGFYGHNISQNSGFCHIGNVLYV